VAEKADKVRKERKWVVPVVTTVIGIVVTLLVAWYQSGQNEEQAKAAEVERRKAVHQNLVLIVEDHIINEKTIDLSRLARLSDLRTREEKLSKAISILGIIEKAEFNIINSQYLDFTQKDKFKKSFDQIYSELSVYKGFDYNGQHSNLVKDLMESLQNGNNEDQKTKLARVLDAFNQDLISLEVKSQKPKSISVVLNSLTSKLPLLAGVMAIVAFLMTFFERELRKRLERRRYMRLKEVELEREILRREVEELSKENSNK